MVKLVGWILWGGLLVGGTENAGAEPVVTAEQRAVCEAIRQCQRSYRDNSCDSLRLQAELAPFVTSCSAQDVETSFWKGSAAQCGQSTVTQGAQFLQTLTALPGSLRKNSQKHFEQNQLANRICYQKLGVDWVEAEEDRHRLRVAEIDNNRRLGDGRTDAKSRLRRCWNREIKVLRNYQFPEWPRWSDAVEAFRGMAQGMRCLNAAGQSRFVCPMVASAAAGGLAGYAAKAALSRLARRAHLAVETQDAFAHLDKNAQEKKEKLTVVHQEDLVGSLESPAVKALGKSLPLQRSALVDGMIDSDMGKMMAFWKTSILADPVTSDKFIRILQGVDRSPEGRVVRKLLDDDYGGGGLLPPGYKPATLRKLFSEQPILRGYHHELPGIQRALDDFRAGTIDEGLLRARLQANLGHNGPDAGFWSFFSETLVPSVLARHQNFYNNTIYGGGRRAETGGVLSPKYPMPTSAEGFVHMGLDRLSQGTRGGIEKIFYERGGDGLKANAKMQLQAWTGPDGQPAGLNILGELLFENPRRTSGQIQAMSSSLSTPQTLSHLTGGQRRSMVQFSEAIKARLLKEADFIDAHAVAQPRSGPPYHRIVLSYQDAAGNPVRTVVDGRTPADEAIKRVNLFLLAEERRHGNPMTDLESGPQHSKPAVVGALVGAAIPNYCQRVWAQERRPSPTTRKNSER